ncbi:MAG: type II secretion system protein [Sphingobacteriia bacterium]|nr:type II secretion system protein [Sphingobacteriia bacterium]
MKKNAFTLVELSIVLLITSIILGIVLAFVAEKTDADKLEETRYKIEQIDKAIRAYFIKNQKIPCPSDGTLAFTNSNFGVALRDTVNNYQCSNTLITSGSMKLGMVPVRTLNLADEFATDSWGRRFTYAIIESCNCKSNEAGCATQNFESDFCGVNVADRITILGTSGGSTIMSDAVLVIISHGRNGHGAFAQNGGSSRIVTKSGGISNDELENSHLSAVGANLGFDRTFVARNQLYNDTPASNFDDIVYYKNRIQLVTSIKALRTSQDPICTYKNTSNFSTNICGDKTTANCVTIYNSLLNNILCFDF